MTHNMFVQIIDETGLIIRRAALVPVWTGRAEQTVLPGWPAYYYKISLPTMHELSK